MKYLLVIFAGSSALWAQPKAAAPAARVPSCQLLSLTDDCKIFSRPGNESGIRFADGTVIPNPFKERASRPENSEEASRERGNELRAQARIMRGLQAVSSPRISETFQLGLIGSLRDPSVQKALADTDSQRNHEPEPILLPWPPISSNR